MPAMSTEEEWLCICIRRPGLLYFLLFLGPEHTKVHHGRSAPACIEFQDVPISPGLY